MPKTCLTSQIEGTNWNESIRIINSADCRQHSASFLTRSSVTARELIEQALHFRSKVLVHCVEQARVWFPPRLVTFGAAVIGAVGEVVGMALVVSLAFAFALLIPILI